MCIDYDWKVLSDGEEGENRRQIRDYLYLRMIRQRGIVWALSLDNSNSIPIISSGTISWLFCVICVLGECLPLPPPPHIFLPLFRYTLLVDRYTPIIASCLKDRAILVRQQTLECLTILIKEAFIRWEGQVGKGRELKGDIFLHLS